MNCSSFVPFAHSWKPLLTKIVGDANLHGKWLNTLSYMENCGARKIATCEHPTKVKEEMLKHAAEEFRHAHYLKSQIGRVTQETLEGYTLPTILGGYATLHYIQALDSLACRCVKKMGGGNKKLLKEAAYILVTYAIELRASELYPVYHDILKEAKSKVTVKSILLEEEEHLAEMTRELQLIPNREELVAEICRQEGRLCRNFIKKLGESI